MTPNRHQRRTMDAINRTGGVARLAPEFDVCAMRDCKERATTSRIQGGRMLGTFCDTCISALDAAEKTLRERRQAEQLAALPFWRRLALRLYLAVMA